MVTRRPTNHRPGASIAPGFFVVADELAMFRCHAAWLRDGSMTQLGSVNGGFYGLGLRLGCRSHMEGTDDQEPDCFRFLSRLQSHSLRIAIGAAKGRVSHRLDQRRKLWSPTHKVRPRRLRAEMLAWRCLGGPPGMETATGRPGSRR